jgi:hypothetical protein
LINVIVYLPAGNVALPALNVNGMLAIIFWALLVWACAPTTRTARSIIIARGIFKNLFMVNLRMFRQPLFASTYSRGRLARFPSRGRIYLL